MSVVERLNQIMTETVGHAVIDQHRYGFKGSTLPYCPVRDALTKCQESTGNTPNRVTTFDELIRMEIGTTVHAVYQKFLSLRGNIYGDWECSKCHKIFKMMLGPTYHCGRACDYQEIRLYDQNSGFKGAADALIPYGDGYVLIDFKTKAENRMEKVKVERHERAQVFAYKYVLMKPPYEINILGQAIVYISRDVPSNFKVLEIENDDLAEEEFERYVRLQSLSKEALVTGKINELPGLCRNQNDEMYCPYNLLCFGPNRAVNLNSEWERSGYARNTEKSANSRKI